MSCLRKWGVLKRKGWGLKRQSMENESEENEVGVYSGACGNKVLREWKACIYRKGKGRCGSGFRLSFGVFTTALQAGKRKNEAESGTNTVAPSLLLCPSQGVQTWLHTRLGGWSRVRNRAGSQSGWGEKAFSKNLLGSFRWRPSSSIFNEAAFWDDLSFCLFLWDGVECIHFIRGELRPI